MITRYSSIVALLLIISAVLIGCEWMTDLLSPAKGFIRSAQSVTIYEQSGPVVAITFLSTDARLVDDITEGPGGYDFRGVPEEYYDVYISNADGTPNPSGDYLTIQCFRDASYTNDYVGNNIDAVVLDFANGSRFLASFVAKVETGSGLTDPQYVDTRGFAQRALGPPDGLSTRLGDQFTSITLGFRPSSELSQHVDLSISHTSSLE